MSSQECALKLLRQCQPHCFRNAFMTEPRCTGQGNGRWSESEPWNSAHRLSSKELLGLRTRFAIRSNSLWLLRLNKTQRPAGSPGVPTLNTWRKHVFRKETIRARVTPYIDRNTHASHSLTTTYTKRAAGSAERWRPAAPSAEATSQLKPSRVASGAERGRRTATAASQAALVLHTDLVVHESCEPARGKVLEPSLPRSC